MPAPGNPFGENRLIRYMLGSLPGNETEQLDEASIADDAIAEQLRQAEDDLVDAYAAGALSGEMLARFETHYLASPARRDKAAFARRLRRLVDGSPGT